MQRLLIPELESLAPSGYRFLVQRDHPWQQQMAIKGRRLLAATVWRDMIANHQSAEEAAQEWGIPVEAVEEAVRWCEANRALIEMEARRRVGWNPPECHVRLLIDEDTQARTLVRLLKEAGHDVMTAAEAGLSSPSDADVLACAKKGERVLVTRNGGGFLALHRDSSDHPSILAVFQDADPRKAMSDADIVRAIANLEGAHSPVDGQFSALNAWCW